MSTINELPSEERLNSVKENLMGVRELIVRADSIVDTEQYALVGGSFLTLAFGLVWYWDPSFLTFIAFIGFVTTIADYVGPKLLPYILNANDWNEDKEKKYDTVCQNMVRIINNVEKGISCYKEWRIQKPLLTKVITLASLVLLAWIGNRINNFFLAYLITIGMVLLPKITRQGLLQKSMEMLKPQLERGMSIVSSQIESLVSKVQDTVKEKYTQGIKTE